MSRSAGMGVLSSSHYSPCRFYAWSRMVLQKPPWSWRTISASGPSHSLPMICRGSRTTAWSSVPSNTPPMLTTSSIKTFCKPSVKQKLSNRCCSTANPTTKLNTRKSSLKVIRKPSPNPVSCLKRKKKKFSLMGKYPNWGRYPGLGVRVPREP